MGQQQRNNGWKLGALGVLAKLTIWIAKIGNVVDRIVAQTVRHHRPIMKYVHYQKSIYLASNSHLNLMNLIKI